ncbi:hypothetical protein V8D89_013801 [Ganoderma adspersum]
MSSNRWSLSRVWGGTRWNASTSGSTTAGPSSNRSRAAPSQTTNGSRQNRRQSASTGHPTSSSQPRHAQPASREAEEVLYSSPIVDDSLWFAQDFMLGAGMVIIQPSTKKVVVLSEKEEAGDGRAFRYWFLPKGRKDVGESLEQTALREAYEESGLRVTFLPIILPHNAPGAPDTLADIDRRRFLPCTEPIYIFTQAYEKRVSPGRAKGKAEYLTFWYVGQVPDNATVESGTRMEDEVNYETHFLSIGDALSVLHGPQQIIVSIAYQRWLHTVEMQSQSWYKQYIAELHAVAGASSTADPSASGSVQAGADHSRERLASTTQAADDTDSWENSD